MAIKKLGMSAIVASVLTTSIVVAGTLTVNGGISTASSELLAEQAVDANLSKGLIFISGQSAASVTDAGFELKFPNLKIVNAKDLMICNEDNTTVATFDRIDHLADGDSVVFATKSGGTVERGASYNIMSDNDNDENCSAANNADKNIDVGDLELNLPKGTSGASAKLILTSNTGTDLDTAEANIIAVKNQFSLAVKTKLDAQIDASASFLNFINNVVTDDFEFTFTNEYNLTFPAILTGMRVDLVSDHNLSEYKVTVGDNVDNVADAGLLSGGNAIANTDIASVVQTSENNITYTLSSNKYTDALITSRLTTDKSGAMSVTDFTATGGVSFNGYTKELMSGADAGKWTIYGYNAQIPNVGGLEGFETVMKFTNRSNIDTNIYFTLIDPDGTVATLNSVDNPTIAKLPANTTGKYKATQLLALVTDPEFNKKGSISVEVSIPTTPDLVYGMASFKNIALGQFKDLPVYNSSSLGY